ncbi:protein MULTIPLE CHLOROPLAST DIVISION SITE 1 isoform X1 [Macadamia integrifolia]|uniref:protein MULTIPLE CHLOROPLAST DIVISION SITE 1 isoform X1 n=1 Tax=Macadamia integrifolia TaxID=60698 RepID=UPI001C4F389A|nr:protein MULTIPLE CHLOROPLAST DIVISION SITE 1 isoform X1 [Macadamia integrifolia]
MASISTLQFHAITLQPAFWASKNRTSRNAVEFGATVQVNCKSYMNWNPPKREQHLAVRVFCSSTNSGDNCDGDDMEAEGNLMDSKDSFSSLRGAIKSLPPVIFLMKRRIDTNFTVGLCLAIAFLIIAVKQYVATKSRHNQHGSVADLVKRGQLRSDRRGISKPLKYEDPFNNPMVKISKSNSTIEMCGKVYRLAPVTLTEEEQSNHQKRRSRAYQWKRPTIFLKEGDSMPPDVDPDTVSWIPANHPFATTVSDIDEDLAQNNVYQKHGVPFRIQAEHDALQRKLEVLQSEQKLDKLVIDPGSARDFERPFKSFSKSHEQVEHNPFANEGGNSLSPKSNRAPNSVESNTSSEDLQKP